MLTMAITLKGSPQRPQRTIDEYCHIGKLLLTAYDYFNNYQSFSLMIFL
jgi:hypothetical protein